MKRLIIAFLLVSNTARADEPTDVEFKAEIDGTIQKYVEILPKSWSKENVCDVLIVLHGHGSDRWQYIKADRGECKAARDFAAKHRMILISPDYRATTSWMGPKAEADTVQIIGDLRKKYRVSKVFLAGGSMGGTSALIFAALHPDLIAGVSSQNGTANMLEYKAFQEAIAASYGGDKEKQRAEYLKRSPELAPEKFTMPVACTVGGKDKIVPPDSVRKLVKAMQELKKKDVLIIDREDGGHATNHEDTTTALEFILEHSMRSDWPHWRGPARNGITDEDSNWTSESWLPEKPSWTANVGEGASSPLVVGGRVFTLGWDGGKDVLRCLSAKDGTPEWSVEYKCPKYGRFRMGDEGLYSGPSSTPEYDPATMLIYTLSTDGDLNCWDANAKGKKVWGRNLYVDYKTERRPHLGRGQQRDYGYTSSALVHGDWLLVEVGSTKSGSVVAFDKKTGKELWTSELKDEAGHTGGMSAMTVEGVPCVAVLTQRNLAVIRLDKGHEGKTVATFPWVTDFANSIAGPAVEGDSLLLTASYNQNAMVKVQITLTGAKEVWRKKFPSKVCTPVIHDGSVYVAWTRVRCIDWKTGDLKWEGGTIGDPGSCIVTRDGRLVVYGLHGKLILVEGAKRSPTAYKELAVRDKLFRCEAWPHVALAAGRVYCRDREGHLAVFALGSGK